MPRLGNGTPAALAFKEKQRIALKSRLAGFSYEEIAAQLGYKSTSSAYNAIQHAMKEIIEEPAKEVRQMELHRLDWMLSRLYPAIERGDVKSVHAALAIMVRRARLLGLDMPLKIAPTTLDGEEAHGGLILTPDEMIRRIRAIFERQQELDLTESPKVIDLNPPEGDVKRG